MITERDTIKCEAVFSDDKQHRLYWERTWDKEKPKAAMPKYTSMVDSSPRKVSRMPARIRGMAILEPKLVKGMIAARSLMGA